MEMQVFLVLAAGLVVGFLAAWVFLKRGMASSVAVRDEQLSQRTQELAAARDAMRLNECELRSERTACSAAREDVAALRAQMAAEQCATQEKLQALMNVELSLKASFEALAGKALDANSQRLLLLTQQELGKQQADATHDLARKQTAIEHMLRPMQESLSRLSQHSQELESKREGAYQAFLTEIKNIQQSHTDLRRETTQLVHALRAPQVRGNWGELQLRKCVEFAGMVQHASFEVQKFVRGEDANFRPDLVVNLPNGRTIVVDAKTPFDSFLRASDTEDVQQRGALMAAHAARVRQHLKDLASKAYQRQFVNSPDFIVCFLPSEVLFSAALEQDPGLIEFSAASNVMLATPTTLIALLKAVSFGWQQSDVARNASVIRDISFDLYTKLAGLHTALLNLGSKLKGAGDAYNDLVTKTEGRGGVFTQVRKLRELDIGEKELQAVEPVHFSLRQLTSVDWQPTLSLAASEAEHEPS